MKISFQRLCQQKIDWDDELHGELLKEYNSFKSELSALNNVRIPRCYFHPVLNPSSIQIHGFSDASKDAYAAVVYFRSTYEDGTVVVNQIASKSRVAPLKKQSIPRLELLGATILARLVKSIVKALKLSETFETFYWVDSMATLCWIKNQKPWKQYVQHRVQEILSSSKRNSWKFCPGKKNPEDLPSRGVKGNELEQSSLWWNGPDFLFQDATKWPDSEQKSNLDENAMQEVIKAPPHITHALLTVKSDPIMNIASVMNIDEFSNKRNLLRVTAFVLKFIHKLKLAMRNSRQGSKSTQQTTTLSLNAQEIIQAETLWLRSVQMKYFEKEFIFLNSNKTGSAPDTPYVNQFNLFLDQNKVIRCKGRIDNSSLSASSKMPILLPPKDKFTELVIRETHEFVIHNGIRDTLATIRDKFWILRGREAVKRLIRKCVICKRFQGMPFRELQEPVLPDIRVDDAPPFTNTGVDFVGPLHVRKDNSDLATTSKVWICLFTCASTRAIHLELTRGLTVQLFLRCFRRFASRRGLPSRLISDNAKTFRGATAEIRKITRSDEVLRYLANRHITWEFIVEKVGRILGETSKKCKATSQESDRESKFGL